MFPLSSFPCFLVFGSPARWNADAMLGEHFTNLVATKVFFYASGRSKNRIALFCLVAKKAAGDQKKCGGKKLHPPPILQRLRDWDQNLWNTAIITKHRWSNMNIAVILMCSETLPPTWFLGDSITTFRWKTACFLLFSAKTCTLRQHRYCFMIFGYKDTFPVRPRVCFPRDRFVRLLEFHKRTRASACIHFLRGKSRKKIWFFGALHASPNSSWRLNWRSVY